MSHLQSHLQLRLETASPRLARRFAAVLSATCLSVGALCLASAAAAQDAAQDAAPDAGEPEASAEMGAAHIETAAEEVVRARVADYFLGGQAGDQDRLARAFYLDDGHMKFVVKNDDGSEELRVVTLAEFRGWMDKPNTADRVGRILAIDIVDDEMAWVKFQIDFEGGQFIDYLLLYEIGGEWSIVNKMFVRRRTNG